MIKELVTDEAALSTPCEPATADDAQIVEDLVETLGSIEDAALIAANQIGQAKAIIAFIDEDETTCVMLNPKIKRALYPAKQEEQCLTKEGTSKVTRFARVQVTYDELVDGALVPRKRDCADWIAVLVQHGIDHCKGKYV